ncbi:MAG: DUF1688 family protein, partial [Beijerinckiaceae bacterium]
MTSGSTDRAAALALLSAEAVRERTGQLFTAAQEGRLTHFTLAMEKMPALAGFVAKVVRQNYPTLQVPFHARWRHFVTARSDRWATIAGQIAWSSPAARARAEFDLAIVSVLLDAGAGSRWRYRDSAGVETSRSEGLALASLDMFVHGAFSAYPDDPLRADAEKLLAFSEADLRRGFQVTPDNPLEGVSGRVALLNAMGRSIMLKPGIFAREDTPRPGGLLDEISSQARAACGVLPASAILQSVLLNCGDIWPSRLSLGGVPLGDTWQHPLIRVGDATEGLVPFHKLSQWLSYSLIEPLLRAGVTVVDIDGLTGLAEYRNGGLFIDEGVIVPRDRSLLHIPHTPDSAVIVEWRALTVALL